MQEMNGNFYSTPPIMESSVADATSPILELPKAAEKAFFLLLHVQIEIIKGVDVNFLTHVSSHNFFSLNSAKHH